MGLGNERRRQQKAKRIVIATGRRKKKRPKATLACFSDWFIALISWWKGVSYLLVFTRQKELLYYRSKKPSCFEGAEKEPLRPPRPFIQQLLGERESKRISCVSSYSKNPLHMGSSTRTIPYPILSPNSCALCKQSKRKKNPEKTDGLSFLKVSIRHLTRTENLNCIHGREIVQRILLFCMQIGR